MEKKLIFILYVFLCINYSYSQSFYVDSISYDNKDIIIIDETVTFSDNYISSALTLKNTVELDLLLQIKVKCVPESYGGGSESVTLIPLDFTIYENQNKLDYSIFNNTKYYNLTDINKPTSQPSIIEFSISFKPDEIKTIIIQYQNESDNFHYICNSGIRNTIRYFFNKKSQNKTLFYIPNDNISTDKGFSFYDFLFFDEEYIEVKDFKRKIRNSNFYWQIDVPSHICEVVCREDYFCPGEDWSVFHLYYTDSEYLQNENENFLQFRNKNLSKEKLSICDIYTLSKKQLSILRNSFYAKYGYQFKNKELLKYFEDNCTAQGIKFKINPNFSESIFNEIEKTNIGLIKQFENMKD